MAVRVTFDMGREDTLALLQDQVPHGDDVKVTREINTLRVIVATRPWWAQLFFVTWVLRDQEQARFVVTDIEAESQLCRVELTSTGAEAWLYRRLVKLLDAHSVESQAQEAARRESPFSLENMWGGPAPGQKPPKPLGFGGDFFGGPSSKKSAPSREPVDPAGPGAFTRARDAGEF